MSNLIDIGIPEDLKEGTEVELGTWLKQVGDAVEQNEPIAELVTDKAVVELPAPAGGTLVEILVPADSKVELDAVLGRIAVGGEEETVELEISPSTAETMFGPLAEALLEVRGVAPRAGAKDSEPPDSPPAHPAVVRFAATLGIDLSAVEGSGKGGRVTRDDLVRMRLADAPQKPPVEHARPESEGELGPSRFVRHDPMRRTIARNMAESVRTAPHVTAVFECDLTQVLADRERRKAELFDSGIKLTLSAYFLRAAVRGLQEVPEVNSRWHDSGLELFESMHIGVGTALEDRGLVVPVVRNVQDLDLEGCAKELTVLTDRARAGKLTPKEMRGSTFTISNHGVMGSLMASPIIINPPESAILGIGKLERRPVVRTEDGQDRMVIRPMVYVTLTIDHRALDAFHTNRFLRTFCKTLENWLK